jgi:tetratricopeptide (TPR) repeat protein
MLLTKYRWLWLVGLLVFCAAIYWPGLHSPFLFDDFPNLAALDSINHVASWRDLGIYLSQPRGFPGRPLAMLSFLFQKGSWPGHPFPFKLVNLGIHLFCGLLVFRLTSVLARNYQSGNEQAPAINNAGIFVAALLAAAAWLISPIQISGVLLVVQRMTLLMAMFLLVGLLAYLKGLLDEHATETRRGTWMAIGLGLCMVLAFLCKENGVLLPVFALVLDATVLRHQVARLPSGLKWWRRLLIWPTALFVLGYLLSNLSQLGSNGIIRDFTLGERLLTEPRILFDYLSNIFLPRFGIYGLYHDGFPVSRNLLTPWTTLPAMIAVLGAAVWGFAARRKSPLLALAILWYLGGQSIESSTVMLELYFEHRNYVPIMGPFIALAIGLTNMTDLRLRRRLMGLAALWLVASSITTFLSTQVYASQDRLASIWAKTQPESARAQSMLAERFYQHGQKTLALTTIESAIATHPDSAALAENRVFLKCQLGKLTLGDMQALTTLLSAAPFDRGGFSNIETLRLQANIHQCDALNAQSWRLLTHAMMGNPNYSDYVASGFLHYQLHAEAVTDGHLDEAIRQLDAAYAVDPDAEIPRLQAKYLASAGLYDQAIKVLQNTDYAHLPRLRRMLVNDRAINEKDIDMLKKQKAAGLQSSAADH